MLRSTRASPLDRSLRMGFARCVHRRAFLSGLGKAFLTSTRRCVAVADSVNNAPGRCQPKPGLDVIGMPIAADHLGLTVCRGNQTKPLAVRAFHLRIGCWHRCPNRSAICPTATTGPPTAPAVLGRKVSQPASHLEAKVHRPRHGWPWRPTNHRGPCAPAAHAEPTPKPQVQMAQGLKPSLQLQGRPVSSHRKLVMPDWDVAGQSLRRGSLTLVRKAISRGAPPLQHGNPLQARNVPWPGLRSASAGPGPAHTGRTGAAPL